jgi:hypothetical protein
MMRRLVPAWLVLAVVAAPVVAQTRQLFYDVDAAFKEMPGPADWKNYATIDASSLAGGRGPGTIRLVSFPTRTRFTRRGR